MKLSKLILITFVGLIITLMDLTFDMYSCNNEVSVGQLTTTAKTYMHKISHEGAIAFGKVTKEIKKATHEACMNNDNMLAYNTEDLLLGYGD